MFDNVKGTLFYGYQIDPQFYDENEAIFFTLINNTKKDNDKLEMKNNEFTRVMDNVIRSKRNKTNLSLFFHNSVI